MSSYGPVPTVAGGDMADHHDHHDHTSYGGASEAPLRESEDKSRLLGTDNAPYDPYNPPLAPGQYSNRSAPPSPSLKPYSPSPATNFDVDTEDPAQKAFAFDDDPPRATKVLFVIRTIFIVFTFLLSVGILASTADVQATFEKTKDYGKWIDVDGDGPAKSEWWNAWGDKGGDDVNTGPNQLNLGASAATVVLTGLLMILSAQRRFKYLPRGGSTELATVVGFVFLVFAVWAVVIGLVLSVEIDSGSDNSIGQWVCSSEFEIYDIQFKTLCTLSSFAQIGAITCCALMLVTFAVILGSCCAGRPKSAASAAGRRTKGKRRSDGLVPMRLRR